MVLPRGTLESYLIGRVKHPTVECTIETEGYPKGEGSIALKEDDLEKVIDELIDTTVMVNKGSYFKSPLYFNNEKGFTTKDVPAITDKE